MGTVHEPCDSDHTCAQRDRGEEADRVQGRGCRKSEPCTNQPKGLSISVVGPAATLVGAWQVCERAVLKLVHLVHKLLLRRTCLTTTDLLT